MNSNMNKDFNKTNNFLPFRKQKNKLLNNVNDSINNKDKTHNNSSFLNISDIKSNRLHKKKNDEKEKMSKTAKLFNRNSVFGGVDKNKKDFYLSIEFSHKIDNINKAKDEKLLNHHFPMLKNNK